MADEQAPIRNIAPLTEGETALAQSIFGDGFRTDNLRKYYQSRAPFKTMWRNSDAAAYVPSVWGVGGNALHFIGDGLQAADFSRGSSYQSSTFMHEMTHIWQMRYGGGKSCGVYEYTLTPESRFTDFCAEQQAEIIADYTMSFLKVDAFTLYNRTIKGLTTFGEAPHLARVVEEQFPAAATARRTRARSLESCIRTQMQRSTARDEINRFAQGWVACEGPEDNTRIGDQPVTRRIVAHLAHTVRRL